MNIGSKCPVERIEWIDENGGTQRLELFFQDGVNIGKSKGLKQISKELGFSFDPKIKLSDLKIMLSKHKAFQSQTKLEILGFKYNVKVLYCPKFHCELNPIEGLWCFQKKYVRYRTDQNYDTMIRLIYESRQDFVQKEIYAKLWRRFWRCINAYQKGVSYGDILTTYFSGKSKEKVETHRKIYNQNL